MALSQSAVESLVRSGRFQEVVSDWSVDPAGATKSSSVDHRLALAEALLRTGRIQPAKSIASAANDRHAAASIRARCEMVLGLVARELGYFDEALQRLQLSSRLAKESGNTAQAAWSSLSAFRISAERQSRDVASAVLQEVRGLVLRAGDPHLTASLHESVARHEAQIGNLDEARRHLKVAAALISRYPNAWLEQLVAVNEFCVEFSSCNLRKAEESLAHAGSLETTSGSLAQIIANNAGHIQLQVGKFDDAESTLRRIAESNVGRVRQSALDGLARLHLARGMFDECERTLNDLSEVERGAELVPSFPFRSSLLTRIRLLLHQSKWSQALDTADKAIAESTAVADTSVLAASLFLRGLALEKLDQQRQASISILSAVERAAWSLREHQGVLLQACSRLTLDREPRIAARFFDRARRVWRAHGNSSAEAEFKNFGEQLQTDPSNSRRAPHETVSSSVPSLLNSLASAFDFSYNPRLLGEELKQVVEDAHCSPRTQILEHVSAGPISGEPSYLLQLGKDGDRTLTLVCDPPDDPVSALVLGDVMRIGRAAVALERAREEDRNRAALWPADPVEEQGDAIFLAEEMRDLLATIRKVARTTVPVLITGETGTGKDVVARTIHACSMRAKNVFLPFNCASTPKEMLDSQLFGHRRGAFTGAIENFQGVVRSATGGTLFLDEIGDTGLDVQPKLLRFLDNSEVHAIGEAQPTRVDVRIVAATNADIDRLVGEGRFREDLFYRLSVIRLRIPPLRERRVEIPALANHYLRRHAQEYRKGELRLSEDTMEYLVLYKWPGNVRQLASEMRRMAALAESDAVLMPQHLSPEIAASRRTLPPSERALEPTEVIVRIDQPMPAATQHLEQTMIQYALKKCDGRVEETAAMLGISRKGLYLKRQRFGIELPAEAQIAAAEA